MQPDFSHFPQFESIKVKDGVIALTGYGLDVRVDRGRLSVQDGIANNRRETRFTKATCGIKRFVILGHSGTISLEALRWLHDIGAGVFQIDADGQVILASAVRGLDNVFLRRAQALAGNNELGITIAKGLIAQKIARQADVAKHFVEARIADEILTHIPMLEQANDVALIRLIEGQAANIYWNCLADVQMSFVRKDESHVPEHWRRFVQRGSPITGNPRNAGNPINSLLNYLYAILEGETRIAILTIGLDPGMAFLHQDLQNRDSLIYDIMEAVRPDVDAWLFAFLRKTRFLRKDFFERRDGTVRISSQVTSLLAQTVTLWKRKVAPHVEWVAKMLVKTRNMKSEKPIATPLTQSNRLAGRVKLGFTRQKIERNAHIIHRKCKECGKAIQSGRSQFCSNECLNTYKEKYWQPNFEKSGVEKLQKMREKGEDPAHGGESATKRGRSNAKRARERAQWEAIHGDGKEEREIYVKEILPTLKTVELSRIRKITGFSKRYAWMIQQGTYIPHPVHYQKLIKLIHDR